jgi:hypothetical protein
VLPSERQIPGGGGVAAITTACPLGVAAPTTGRPRLSNSQTAVPIAPTANSTAPTTMDQRFILWPLTKTSTFPPCDEQSDDPNIAHRRRETLLPTSAEQKPPHQPFLGSRADTADPSAATGKFGVSELREVE